MNNAEMALDSSDTFVSKSLRNHGGYQPVIASLMKQCVRPGAVALDGGAHIGTFTLLLSSLVGPSGHVHAFEPSSRNYALLVKNIQNNSLENVTAVQSALGFESGEATLYLNGRNTGDCRMSPCPNAAGVESVSVTTIDQYMADKGGRLNMLKLDTQGCEFPILGGAARTVANSPGMVLIAEMYLPILNELGIAVDDVVCLLLNYGFSDFCLIHEKKRESVKPENISGTILASPRTVYDIFCRRSSNA